MYNGTISSAGAILLPCVSSFWDHMFSQQYLAYEYNPFASGEVKGRRVSVRY